MDYNQLKYFKTLSIICNFTKASDELDLSQSALSRSISKLEEELGVPLFQRKSRGVVLNQYGKIFLSHINQVLWEIDEAKEEINNMVDPSHGTISLAFIQLLGSNFVPDSISGFQKQEPGIRFHLIQDTSNKILDMIESGEIDVGFCSPQEPIKNLSSFQLTNEELFLIVNKDHILADKMEVDLCEVANDPFIIYKPETSLHDVIDKLCQSAGFHQSMSFEAFDEGTVAGLVGAKLGVALIPFIPGLDMQKVSLIHVRKPHCFIGIQMVYRTNGYMSPALKHFISYVENATCLHV